MLLPVHSACAALASRLCPHYTQVVPPITLRLCHHRMQVVPPVSLGCAANAFRVQGLDQCGMLTMSPPLPCPPPYCRDRGCCKQGNSRSSRLNRPCHIQQPNQDAVGNMHTEPKCQNTCVMLASYSLCKALATMTRLKASKCMTGADLWPVARVEA